MDLPLAFLNQMKALLGDDYDAFIQTYDEEPTQGLRLNLNKIDETLFLAEFPHLLRIPWVKEGFYFDENEKPSKHPYHDAGMYYIQEPSAMSVGAFVNAQENEVILDLCASPGGKTSHLASHMRNTGLIVANEIYPTRAKTLSQNIERMGITNTVITQETPERLTPHFMQFFDKVLVDAPCSGEGMFRKDKDMLKVWSEAYVSECVIRQKEILTQAVQMLKPGGTIVYSTCTFNVEENEGIIDWLIKTYPEFEVVPQTLPSGFVPGCSDTLIEPSIGIEHTMRIYPHLVKGEGHFIAVLKKAGQLFPSKVNPPLSKKLPQLLPYVSFVNTYLTHPLKGDVVMFNDHLYLVPSQMTSLDGLKIVRAGLYLGSITKDRFEPSHALALALNKTMFSPIYEASLSEAIAFYKGLTLQADGLEKGYYLIAYKEAILGFAKYSESFFKNHYPKGKRWN